MTVRPGCPAVRPFPRLRVGHAARALVQAALLLIAAPAFAELVVSAAERSISTSSRGGTPFELTATTTSGGFSEEAQTVEAQDSGLGAFARADQVSSIGPLLFVAEGHASVTRREGTLATANSFATIFFTLTSAFNFIGSAELGASGDVLSLAGFELRRLGTLEQVLVEGTEASGAFDFAGLLEAGDYQLSAFAHSEIVTLANSPIGGAAVFDFSMAFSAADGLPPGNEVPEPLSASLVLLGLVGAAAAHRTRCRAVVGTPMQA